MFGPSDEKQEEQRERPRSRERAREWPWTSPLLMKRLRLSREGERLMKSPAGEHELWHELACPAAFPHMRERKSADGAVANLVRSGRKQPQRFRAGSSASTHERPSAAKQRVETANGGRPAA